MVYTNDGAAVEFVENTRGFIKLFGNTTAKDNNLKEDELRKAKEMYKGALSLSLESTLSRAFWLGNRMLLYGRPSTFDEIKEKIEEVKVKDIQKMAQNIFNKDKINLSIVGPFKEKDKKGYSSLLQEL